MPVKISVIVCTYNGAAYLHEQLESLLNQTLLPAEIILHDDGSTDTTLDIAEEYRQRLSMQQQDITFRIVRNEGPHGVNGNFFGALHAAQHELIAICDQDDIWEPTKLERQHAAIENALLCGCISQPFSTDGSPVQVDERPVNLSPLRMMYVGMMPGHTMLLRRELLRYVPRGDFFMYDLQLQMAAATLQRLAYVPEVLVHQRRYPQATTYLAPQSKWQILRSTLRNFLRLRPQVRRRFHEWELYFATGATPLPTEQSIVKMMRLQQGSGTLNYVRLTCFCLWHRHELLPTPAIRGLRAMAYGLAFPLTCINYYRYFLDRK